MLRVVRIQKFLNKIDVDYNILEITIECITCISSPCYWYLYYKKMQLPFSNFILHYKTEMQAQDRTLGKWRQNSTLLGCLDFIVLLCKRLAKAVRILKFNFSYQIPWALHLNALIWLNDGPDRWLLLIWGWENLADPPACLGKAGFACRPGKITRRTVCHVNSKRNWPSQADTARHDISFHIRTVSRSYSSAAPVLGWVSNVSGRFILFPSQNLHPDRPLAFIIDFNPTL